jgi:hypothetical protein
MPLLTSRGELDPILDLNMHHVNELLLKKQSHALEKFHLFPIKVRGFAVGHGS